MSSILDSLVSSQAPPSNQPSGAVGEAGIDNPQGPAPAAPDIGPLAQKYPFLGAISDGQLAGVYVPKDFHAPSTKELTPQILMQGFGLGMYKPKDPNAMLTVFNTKVLPIETLKKLDLQGKLTSTLPPITQFIPNEPKQGQAGQVKQDANAQVTPLPGPTNTKVPVQGKSLLASLTNAQSPTDRPMPGAGVLLNGLLKRAV